MFAPLLTDVFIIAIIAFSVIFRMPIWTSVTFWERVLLVPYVFLKLLSHSLFLMRRTCE